jgi:hypothetical protein
LKWNGADSINFTTCYCLLVFITYHLSFLLLNYRTSYVPFKINLNKSFLESSEKSFVA